MDMTRERMFHKVHPHAASHDYLHFSGRFCSFKGPWWSTMKARAKQWTAGFGYSHGAPLSELTKRPHIGVPSWRAHLWCKTGARRAISGFTALPDYPTEWTK
jgi:hypothetical protein